MVYYWGVCFKDDKHALVFLNYLLRVEFLVYLGLDFGFFLFYELKCGFEGVI